MQLSLSGKQYRQLRAAVVTARNEALFVDNHKQIDSLNRLLDYLKDERDRFNEQEEAEATRNSDEKVEAWRKYGEGAYIVESDKEKQIGASCLPHICTCGD